MIYKLAIATLLLCTGAARPASAQIRHTVDSLGKAEQACLDEGRAMLRCTRIFYNQMDSLLNVVYILKQRRLSEKEKRKLKSEQLSWLSKRDVYFKKMDDEYRRKSNSGEWGEDNLMMTTDDKADFVRRRILVIAP